MNAYEPLFPPAKQGFRMPAEWEPHDATWLAWSHGSLDWPGKISPIPWVFAEMVRKIAVGEKVRILAGSAAQEDHAVRVLSRVGVLAQGSSSPAVEFFRIPTNRAWTRDYGPIYIRRETPHPEIAIAGFRFNAWARYPDYDRDCRVSELIARATHRVRYSAQCRGEEVVLEGGSIDVNGRGSLLTTEECLLDREVQARNPHLERSDIETVLGDYLGVSNVIWLGRGIVGDDTHGHVDDICRFVAPGTVVLCRESNSHDENYRALEENAERLQGCRREDGTPIETVFLPMPAPLFMEGRRLPASYANFFVANQVVIVPTFNDPSDRVALGILAELFKDRTVVGIHAVDLVWGRGTLHCLTQQEPKADSTGGVS